MDDKLRGAPESNHANENAPLYSADERVLEELDNHRAAVALHYMHYNFRRVHQTLRVTPAMEAGITDHVWTIEEIVGPLDVNAARVA